MSMYKYTDANTIIKDAKDGPEQLSNFVANITHETRYIDAGRVTTILTIDGLNEKKRKLPPVDVPAREFSAMSWVPDAWGTAALIMPGFRVKDDLRTAIQIHSDPIRRDVYTHTGWVDIKGRPHYLHADGAINAKGPTKSVFVELPVELQKYQLPTELIDPREAINASLQMLNQFPIHISAPLIAATYRPLLGPTDFALHLEGRTGTFKSELCSLAQAHYGPMDARSLPGSWSSTANALEALAYRAKNALFVIDDFIPAGNHSQQKAYAKTADQIIRGQGNQAGRARLTDTSKMQETMYPRGLVVSTGEDTPEGHSCRARMFIIEITPGDIDAKNLSRAQKNRHILPRAIAGFAQYLAADEAGTIRTIFQRRVNEIRDKHLTIGHSRTPTTLANLVATIEVFAQYALDVKAIQLKTEKAIVEKATTAIIEQAARQAALLQNADLADLFVATLRTVFAGLAGHVRSVRGGVPRDPLLLGWSDERSFTDDTVKYKAHGKQLGWIDWKRNELLLDANIIFEVIQKMARGSISVTKNTCFRRLKDAGIVTRTDKARQRNTIRMTCEGAVRNVIALDATQIIETEKPEEN